MERSKLWSIAEKKKKKRRTMKPREPGWYAVKFLAGEWTILKVWGPRPEAFRTLRGLLSKEPDDAEWRGPIQIHDLPEVGKEIRWGIAEKYLEIVEDDREEP
jgi:hypothetical protein